VRACSWPPCKWSRVAFCDFGGSAPLGLRRRTHAARRGVEHIAGRTVCQAQAMSYETRGDGTDVQPDVCGVDSTTWPFSYVAVIEDAPQVQVG
jgi:hypothetical protein